MKNQPILFFLISLMLFFLSCEINPSKTAEKINTSTEISSSKVTPPANPTTSDSLLKRFEGEINNFVTIDSRNAIKPNGILFTGSSSIRMWKTMAEDLPEFPVVNRGFGGATIPEVLHYMGMYVFQHQPQVIVFYCGENDISEGASPEQVLASFKTFVKIVETRLPDTKILFLSMKPSIARWNLWDKYEAGNNLIKEVIAKNPKLEYMDASISMLEKNGEVKKDIFIEDGLHMNAKGYAGWTEQIKPILKKMYVRSPE